MQRILTVPSVLERGAPYFVTGNHAVSLSRIAENGTIEKLAFLSGALSALLEFQGSIAPFVQVDGADAPVLEADYACDFIPTFSGGRDYLSYSLCYAAPEQTHGFVCRFTLHATREADVCVGFSLSVTRVMRAIFRSYEMEGRIHAFCDAWTNTLVCELIAGKSYGGFGICGDNAVVSAGADGGTAQVRMHLKAGETREAAFYVSVASETDGIGLAAMDMRRRGTALVERHAALLRQRHVSLPNARLERYANFNQNFCYYFSCGYTLDTDELSLVTSKSTAYYVSAAFWSRDVYLWTFPTLLRVSPALAREALLCGFTKYARHIGIHALYLDGRTLYPGFELDEQVAPILALKRYIEKTGDEAILSEACVQAGLAIVKHDLMARYDESVGLFSTELDASDDPVTNAFNTYDNALCVAALRFLGEAALAESVREKLETLCVTEVGGKRVFAYSAEINRRELYDDPPGSLALLPYYGAVSRESALWQNTLAYIYSGANPYYYENGALFGTGCEHTPHPWSASLINRILGCGRADEKTLAALERVAEAYPIVCESFSLADGSLNTGDAFATMAGFVADGVFQAFGK